QGATAPIDLSYDVADADGDTLTITISSAPEHGSVEYNSDTGYYDYTADSDYEGEDDFEFTAYDGTLYSETATVSLQVVKKGADTPKLQYMRFKDGYDLWSELKKTKTDDGYYAPYEWTDKNADGKIDPAKGDQAAPYAIVAGYKLHVQADFQSNGFTKD